MELSFEELRDANVSRCEASFHELDAWSPTDWACALGGEVGEALNMVKKLRRQSDADAPYNKTIARGHSMSDAPCSTCGDLDGCHLPARLRDEAAALNENIGKELADVVIYADLLAARLGISLGDAVRKKFNEVSERVGSDVRISDAIPL